MIIEEMLLQRYQGVKNEDGVWVTPAFPKLIYVLEDDNITEDSPYWYLTELAAKCTARRMVPDYISEKKMKELKGDVYTCMGCRSFLPPDRFTDAGIGNIANAKNYEPGKHKMCIRDRFQIFQWTNGAGPAPLPAQGGSWPSLSAVLQSAVP